LIVGWKMDGLVEAIILKMKHSLNRHLEEKQSAKKMNKRVGDEGIVRKVDRYGLGWGWEDNGTRSQKLTDVD
jgi:hypothetical protein